MQKLTIKDCNFKDKKVLIRVDFNVPLDNNKNITDDIRIRAALPTIKYILEKNAKKVILMSHLGRPKGEIKEELRLTPIAKRLEELIGESVLKLNDCIGPEVESKINSTEKRLILLENLRFHIEEEKNDNNFARNLAKLADIYVNDAFGTAHRAHASTTGVTKYLISAAGFLLEKEIKYLGEILKSPQKPFAVILGGAKVSDKIGVIENLLPKADIFLIGGGMAYTFLKAQGERIGRSKVETNKIDLAKQLIQKANKLNVKFILPIDHVVTNSIEPIGEVKKTKKIPDDFIAVDIGEETIKKFNDNLKDTKTICWNGPLGISEIDLFVNGTRSIAEFIANIPAITIIGGGDTAAAISKFNLQDKMTHISTGGGASLEYMEGKILPGIDALSDKR
jgi:phosphoglycerate kinase